MLKHAAVLD